MASIFFRKNKHIIQQIVRRQGYLPTLNEAIQYILIIQHGPVPQKEKVIIKENTLRKSYKSLPIKKKRKEQQITNLESIFLMESTHPKEEKPIEKIRDTSYQNEMIKEQVSLNVKKSEKITEEFLEKSLKEDNLVHILDHAYPEEHKELTELKRIKRLRKKAFLKVLKVINPYNIEDTPEAFRKFFLSRYEMLKKILVKKMSGGFEDNNTDLIVLVREVIDYNNYGIIIGEYLTDDDEITNGLFLVSFNHDEGVLKEKFNHIIPDVVIGLRVKKTSRGKFIVNDIIFPDVPRLGRRGRASEDTYVLFLSDIHLGSKKFIKEMFLRFLDFVNGAVNDKELKEYAEKLDYIIILGDIVDGVGVYPDQKNELEIPNIYDQYLKISEYLEQIPEDIDIIIIPGNHDAAGNFIPQPPIPVKIAEPLYNLKNVKILSNPAMIEIENVKMLLYHGYGLEKIASMLHMGIEKPTRIINELLRYRHLIPTWGSIPLAPLSEDHLVIYEVPDIIAMGHLHIFDARVAKGNILTIVPGSFQDITSRQKRLSIVPTPGVFGLLNLRTFELKVLKFTEKEIKLLKNAY